MKQEDIDRKHDEHMDRVRARVAQILADRAAKEAREKPDRELERRERIMKAFARLRRDIERMNIDVTGMPEYK